MIRQAKLPRGAYRKTLGEVIAPYVKQAGHKLKSPEQVYHKSWCKFDYVKNIPCNCGVLKNESK